MGILIFDSMIQSCVISAVLGWFWYVLDDNFPRKWFSIDQLMQASLKWCYLKFFPCQPIIHPVKLCKYLKEGKIYINISRPSDLRVPTPRTKGTLRSKGALRTRMVPYLFIYRVGAAGHHNDNNQKQNKHGKETTQTTQQHDNESNE